MTISTPPGNQAGSTHQGSSLRRQSFGLEVLFTNETGWRHSLVSGGGGAEKEREEKGRRKERRREEREDHEASHSESFKVLYFCKAWLLTGVSC